MYVQKNGGWRQQIGESTPALKAEVDALLLFRCWPVRPDVKTWYRGSMIFCILSWVILFLIQAPITMIKNQPPPKGLVPLFYLLSFFFRLLLLLFRLLSQQADRYVPLTGFHVKCYTKHLAHVYAVCAHVAHTRPRTYAKLWGCVTPDLNLMQRVCSQSGSPALVPICQRVVYNSRWTKTQKKFATASRNRLYMLGQIWLYEVRRNKNLELVSQDLLLFTPESKFLNVWAHICS